MRSVSVEARLSFRRPAGKAGADQIMRVARSLRSGLILALAVRSIMGLAWAQDAVSADHAGAAAARRLAQSYEAGVNGCRDPVKALQYYQLALAQGDRSAAPEVMRLMSAASAPPPYAVPTAV